MSENPYSTIILSADGGANSRKPLLLLAAAGAVICVLLHIYFLYALVSISHALGAGQKEFFNNEYAYQEQDIAYQALLRDIEKEYMGGQHYSGVANAEFALSRPSLVLR